MTNATGLLTVSSKRDRRSRAIKNPDDEALELEIEVSYPRIMLDELDGMDPYDQHACAYQASCAEKLFRMEVDQCKYKCTKCLLILSTSEDKINDDLLEIKEGQNTQPSASTLKLVIFANAIMKMYIAKDDRAINRNAVWKTICKYIDSDDIFTNFDTNHDQQISIENSHKNEFIAQLVKIHLSMKFGQIAKKITQEEGSAFH